MNELANNAGAAMPMPQYKSHKLVYALKIKAVLNGPPGAPIGFSALEFYDTRFAPRTVSADYLTKHKPEPGGYFVVYQDGYESFSPAGPFETGYAPYDPDEPARRAHPQGGFIEGAARVAHEVNRAYSEAVLAENQAPWDELSDEERASKIDGVRWLQENPDADPAMVHEAWLHSKTSAGWVYGPVKDVERKQHPYILPFTGLSRAQQAKDVLFVTIVRSLGGLR